MTVSTLRRSRGCGCGCRGLVRSLLSSQYPKSSNAPVESEDKLDGDDGAVGGVSGRAATVTYFLVLGYIFAARLCFAARRR
jgi:hypothetical protein